LGDTATVLTHLTPIGLSEIRIDKIARVWKHPDSVKLYCEEIDIDYGELCKILQLL
jgi:tRNA-binding EMAP/Myf-like protein